MMHAHKKTISFYLICILVVGLTMYGLYLRVNQRRSHDLWTDENEQVKKIATLSLKEILVYSRRVVQFPGDYLLVRPFYQMFGKNKWGLALPHIISTLCGFYLLYLLCKTYFKTPWGYGITFLVFSLNRNLVFHSFEIRPYSVLITISLAAFLVVRYMFRHLDVNLSKKIMISLFIAFTLMFHYFGAFILFFAYMYHLIYSREGKPVKVCLLSHLKSYAPVVICVLPLWIYFISADFNYMKQNTFEFISSEAVPFFKSIFGNLVGDKRLYFLLPGFLVSFFIPHKERWQQIVFFVILVVLPISLILVSCIMNHYWFIQRLFVWVMPLFAFLLGWCWDSAIYYFQGLMAPRAKLT